MVRQEPPKSLASPGPPAVSADEQSEALQCWLRTGFVLYRSCVGLDRFLAELSRDYHRMVLQQASSVRPDEQLACTCQVALYDPASSCDTCKRVADAIQSSGGPPDQRPALTWSNSDPTLWLDLRLGAWEVAKLYAGSMGPPFLARSTSPREADVGTKLTILRGLAKVTHALDPAVVAAVGEAHQRWLGKASREMSKAESSEVQQAMQGLIEAVHGVHEASQQYLIEALQATETISGSADLLRSYGPAVVEAVLTEPIKRIRVQRLEASGAAEAETAGLLERLTSASAGLGSVASAVVERVDRVLADRQQAAAKGSGGGGDKRPTSHLIGAEDDEDDEEEDSEAIAQLEKKFHGGVRPELQSTLASIRAAIEQRNSKEVLRLGLPLLLKAKDLLPVELHCTHEYLSWAYSAEKRMPQARAAIDKALQVPGIYCPLALRLKWRNLEIIEDANESAEESRALMMESLETLDLIKEEDELPSDRSRRVAISVNLCFLHFQQLRQLSREEESEETVTTMREICRESIERLTGTVEAFKQGQVRKEQQPFLWVSAQRLLGLFLTEASVKEPESGGGYLDRAIECYHEVIQTVIYHRFVRGLVNQETQQLATYRLELARIHLQRRRGEEDEQAALALFDACFETAQEAGEIINTLRYRAEFLNERGDKNNDEGDLRAAINDYQQVRPRLHSGPVAPPWLGADWALCACVWDAGAGGAAEPPRAAGEAPGGDRALPAGHGAHLHGHREHEDAAARAEQGGRRGGERVGRRRCGPGEGHQPPARRARRVPQAGRGHTGRRHDGAAAGRPLPAPHEGPQKEEPGEGHRVVHQGQPDDAGGHQGQLGLQGPGRDAGASRRQPVQDV